MWTYILKNPFPILSSILALFAVIFSFKASQKTNYVNTITSERIKWLSKLKELTSGYIACCYNLQNNYEELKELQKLNKLLKLYLNPKEDKSIIKLLDEILILACDARRELDDTEEDSIILDLMSKGDLLITHMQAKAKTEWERIKKESKSLRRNKTNPIELFNEYEIIKQEIKDELSNY